MANVTRGAIAGSIDYLLQQGTLVGSSDAQLLERFIADRDETAFEALISRHGRSVQAVCRDVLRDQHDAEDAFQATFLIRKRTVLPGGGAGRPAAERVGAATPPTPG